MDKLRIISLNARGLKNKLKRTAIFNYLKQHRVDIACIQESHVIENDVVTWEKQWGGKILYNKGTSKSRGEMILISKHFSGSVKIEKCQDRLIIVSIEYGEIHFVLVNIYAPNDTTEKIRFFNILQTILFEYRLGNLIIMGDFNCVINNELDIISGHPHKKTEVDQFIETVTVLGTQDAWRIFHPDEKEFTWCRHTPFIARRLDYCFVAHEALHWLVSCDHLSVCNTDHKAVIIELNSNKLIRGPGYWRFNNSYLNDIQFVDSMNNVLDNLINQNECYSKLSSVDKWEFCKSEIKEFCAEYGKSKAIKNRNEVLMLQLEMKKIEQQLIKDSQNEYLLSQYLKLKQKLEINNLEKARGAQIRARVKWIEQGEKNTKFFLNLEKIRARQNTITRLKLSSGQLITNQGQILEEQVKYYQNLYSQETNENSELLVNDFLVNEKFPCLEDNEADYCETEITLKEATYALASMKNGSAPGNDGITVEFIKFFWKKIGQIILDSFKESFDKGELSYSQKKGVIILLHKGKHLDRENLNNWRPITLTNTDYKLLAKILAVRLSLVIPRLINEDQVGYLKGRNISTVIRTIDDVINYLNVTGKAGYLLALDYKKAFDTISKSFMLQAFKTFGFKTNFVKWVQVLINGTNSCINHGGWLSESFAINCGIRQGCPFSPLAFILSVELLAIKIRNSTITGITLPNLQHIKIKQLADDTTLFLHDRSDLDKAILIVNKFTQFSGLKLNVNKTKIMKMGCQNIPDNLPFECVKKIKVLGITFCSWTMARNVEENWTERIEKLNNLIKSWSARDLSIHGKVVIIKTFLLSQFNFVMQSIGLPEKILININQIMYKFVWQRKFSNRKAFEKVKRKILQKDYNEGGIKMVDMFVEQHCYYLNWAGKLASNTKENWSVIPNWHFNHLTGKLSVFNINCRVKMFKQWGTIRNKFWESVLRAFLDEQDLTLPINVNPSNILDQPLFNNVNIQYKHSVLFFKEWIKRGILKIENIVQTTENRLLTLKEIQDIIGHYRAQAIFEYNALVNALPQQWKDWIKNGNFTLNTPTEIHTACFFNTKIKNIKKVIANKCKHNITPYAHTFWQRKFDIEIDEKIWEMPRKATKEVRLLELQWKIMHAIYPTNIILQKMKKVETNKCLYCRNEIDSLEHFFFNCTMVLLFWKHVNTLLTLNLGKAVKCTIYSVLFGCHDDAFNTREKNYINLVLLVGKMCISIAKKTNVIKNLIPLFEHHLQIRRLQNYFL